MLTRTMKKVEKAAAAEEADRNRMRSVNKKVIAIALLARERPEGEERRVERYRELVSLTRKIVHQAEECCRNAASSSAPASATETITEILETMTGGATGGAANQGAVFQGITKYPHKIVSLFEPHTEIIARGRRVSQTNRQPG